MAVSLPRLSLELVLVPVRTQAAAWPSGPQEPLAVQLICVLLATG